MRVQRFLTAAAGDVPLGSMTQIKPGSRVTLAGAGATGDTVRAQIAGETFYLGPINIEVSADVVDPRRDWLGSAVLPGGGAGSEDLTINVAGTVTGTHVNVYHQKPGTFIPGMELFAS